VKTAESHATEDQARRELIDARNQADSLGYQVEKTLAENRQKLPVGELSAADAAVAAVKAAVQADDLAAIKQATDQLQRAAHAIAESLYKASQNSGTGNPHQAQEAGTNVKEGEVVDAEYAETR